MSKFLRQATASQARALGPFVDDTDFKTLKTGLTIANTDIKLVINGAASANKNSGGGTHRVNGVYGVTFDATDTATVGEMQVSVLVTGALVVFDTFFVVEEVVYDALFAASAPGYGTAQTGDSYAEVTNASYGLSKLVRSTTPANTLDVSATGEAGLDFNNIKDASAGHTLANITVPVVTTTGTVTNGVTLAVDAVDATALAASAATEIAAAVQTSAASTPLPANLKKINGTTVLGDGSATPWGP